MGTGARAVLRAMPQVVATWAVASAGVLTATWNNGPSGRAGALILTGLLGATIGCFRVVLPGVVPRILAGVPVAVIGMVTTQSLIGRSPSLVAAVSVVLADLALSGVDRTGSSTSGRPHPAAAISVAIASTTWAAAQHVGVTGALLAIAAALLVAGAPGTRGRSFRGPPDRDDPHDG